jgi:membrane fusion protein (multidrug efflux system)
MNLRLKNHPFVNVRNVLSFLAIAVVVASCVTRADDLSSAKEPSAPAPIGTPVDAVVLKPAEIRESLDVTGTLVANQRVDIVSELTRKIVSVRVKEGSTVKRGQLLFVLDDADLQAQLERLHQQERLAELNEERLKDLISHEAIAQQDYDQAETNLRVLQAQIRELQVLISKTRITAPFDGQVGIINVHEGAIVSVNTILTDLEDNSVVKVEFSLPEKYSALIKRGSEHTFITASGNREYKARITALAASLSENTRTLLVRAVAANPDGELLPGQSARLNLSLTTSDSALSVTSNALIPSSVGYSVFVAKGSKVQAVPVEIGQRNAGTVEILNGLHKGDTVITSNLLRIGPGAPVHFASLK